MDKTLIISGSEQAAALLTNLMKSYCSTQITVASSGNEARRLINRTEFDAAIISTPLPDEFGVNFAIDTGADTNSGVLLCINADLFEEVTDKCDEYGVLTVSKPTSRQIVKQSLKLLEATRRRLHRMEKKTASFEEKLAEIKEINRAKWLLIENLNMSENEAHKYIERTAMDTRRPKIDIAREIIEEYTKP